MAPGRTLYGNSWAISNTNINYTPNTYISNPSREEKKMSVAVICDNCEKPFKAQKAGAQSLNITEFLKKPNDQGYNYKSKAIDLCPKCAIKVG